jgi:hypothetical protein
MSCVKETSMGESIIAFQSAELFVIFADNSISCVRETSVGESIITIRTAQLRKSRTKLINGLAIRYTIIESRIITSFGTAKFACNVAQCIHSKRETFTKTLIRGRVEAHTLARLPAFRTQLNNISRLNASHT